MDERSLSDWRDRLEELHKEISSRISRSDEEEELGELLYTVSKALEEVESLLEQMK